MYCYLNFEIFLDGWGCWSDWSSCSSSCGTGKSERRRQCLTPGGCVGDAIQYQTCEGTLCECKY